MTAVRIAHVDTETVWRGGQAQILGLVTALAARGHEQLLSCPAGPLAERVRRAGIPWHEWSARSDLDLGAAHRLWRRWQEFAPEVAHLHSARAHAMGAWARGRSGAALVVARRVTYPIGRGFGSHLKYQRAERFLCVSEAAAGRLREAGIGDERIRVVPSASTLTGERVDASALREQLGIREGEAVVGAVGALDHDKGLHVLLEAAAILGERPLRLVLVGEGPERGALERQARDLGVGDRVIFAGGLEARTAHSLLDLLVQPSLEEGLGNSVLEAQALGVPVIASRAGGLPELVQEGETGWLVPAGDAEALARAVADALAHPDEAVRRAARARAAPHTIADVAARTEAVYAEAIEARRS